ncbi:hypothetical protein AAFC00_003146 [Neodothiora populina]|uniref:SPRY domain-containing protein n=1 Tax=Neodothiora populina TaxID=2781224 RepID=A0ABR3P9G9_9PEZI
MSGKSNFNPFRRSNNASSSVDPTQQPFPGEEKFSAPPGPPPGRAYASQGEEKFQPPPGPPPGMRHAPQQDEVYAPPPGPPPSALHASSEQQPPQYAPWMAIPDTSQLPPPPSLAYEQSPTANATEKSDSDAKRWCRSNPLINPRHLLLSDKDRLAKYDINLTQPPQSFIGKCRRTAPGTWSVQTRPNCEDTILLTDLPLFSALEDNVNLTGKPKPIYFEIKVASMTSSSSSYSEASAGIAIGFLAPPYPHWRLPGWERASLGVHGDDGRKYVHNNLGGQDFTTSFKDGEVVGIGMTFAPSRGPRPSVEVFFTREGERVGGWDLHEERDQDDGGSVAGLEGDRDLIGAVGMFGGVEFETRFRRDQWLYRPR